MDDVVVERYKELSANGEIINNPMASSAVTRNFAMTGPAFKTVVNGVTYWGELLGGPWLPINDYYETYGRSVPDYSQLLAETATRAMANVKNPDFDGLVSLGELGESLQLLKNPFRTGLNLAGQLQRRVGMAARHQRRDAAYKEVANATTEFMYGVRPMMKEVSDFLLTLQKDHLKRKSDRQTFRAAGSQSDSDFWTQPGSIVGGAITCTETYTYARTVEVRCGLLYEYFEDLTTNQQFGLSIEYLPEAAWQLVPLSFVVDWFVNVGQFIRAITPVSGARRLSEWTSLKITEKLTRTASGAKFSTWTTARDFAGADSWDRVYKQRYPSIGRPEIYLKGFRQAFSDPDKLLGMSALIIQRLQGAQRLAPPPPRRGRTERIPELYTFS
jgi:hypothetical protein